ncbi:SIS domain-containing protein [Spiroplasma cantharicola]|uniref:Tagatose-6-phosphate ketose/aldose isomerase n=1 Tax=Spiroplasma cantharicola TaxID=362837 RepID=A0A0M4JXN8_9MOLU|nr:SIS domain-containing protein [Spiroplasma cantharicola]ALD66917.1 tagatose-6-phosphate ketose/aldose isomerase [Spiroplasma cantharicola]
MNKTFSKEKFNTVKEILQQSVIWKKIEKNIDKNIKNLMSHLESFKDYKIIFSGAGTSEFIGQALAPYFYKKGLNVFSIATTDIVANPLNFLKKEEKTVIISFARSGNSPESIATFNIANKLIDQVYHLIITCNKDGQLVKLASTNKNTQIFLLPNEANDKGFAMTSSYSGMTFSAFLILDLLLKNNNKSSIEKLCNDFDKSLKLIEENIEKIELQENDRVVYLGSSEFKGFSNEASLKLLELTQGKIPCFYNGVLAFRHGPKSILNKNTTVIIFMSKDNYSRKYEIDLLKEIALEKVVKNLVVLDNTECSEVKKYASIYLNFENQNLNEIFIGLNYILFAQILSLITSIKLNINPDNPCPSGEVNRVVKGVIIHELH